MTVTNGTFREDHIRHDEVTIKESIADKSVWISMQYSNSLVDMMLAL